MGFFNLGGSLLVSWLLHSLDGYLCAYFPVRILPSRKENREERHGTRTTFYKESSPEAATWPIGYGRLGNVVFTLGGHMLQRTFYS